MTQLYYEERVSLKTGLSRRAIYELFKQKKLLLNGNPITVLRVTLMPSKDVVHVDGVRLDTRKVPYVYYKFCKPYNVLTTRHDPKGRACVQSFIDHLGVGIFPVGRLDRYTTGLLLLTNDGEWANQLMHPQFHIPKTYQLRLDRPITHAHFNRLGTGIFLDDGPFKVVEAQQLDKTLMQVVIDEGRNRVLRRVFDALGYRIISLRRLSIGHIQLGNLKDEHSKALTLHEIKAWVPTL